MALSTTAAASVTHVLKTWPGQLVTNDTDVCVSEEKKNSTSSSALDWHAHKSTGHIAPAMNTLVARSRSKGEYKATSTLMMKVCSEWVVNSRRHKKTTLLASVSAECTEKPFQLESIEQSRSTRRQLANKLKEVIKNTKVTDLSKIGYKKALECD